MIGLLTRCGPLSLLGASFVLTISGLFINDLRAVLIALVVEAVVLTALIGRSRFPLIRLLPALFAVLSLAWSNWLLADPRSLSVAVLAAGRVAFFVIPGLVFVSYLDPFTLGDHLGQRMRLPARPVLAGVAALQQLDSFADDWDTLDRARRARGLGPGRSPASRARHVAALSLGLLVGSIRRAAEMTVAMQARGFSAPNTDHPRTWAQPAPWDRADSSLLVLAGVLAVVPHVMA